MMRPVVGKAIPLGTGEIPHDRLSFVLSPNPVSSGRMTIRLEDGNRCNLRKDLLSLTVYNLTGQAVIRSAFTPSVDVSALPGGIYLVVLSDREGTLTGTAKLVITP